MTKNKGWSILGTVFLSMVVFLVFAIGLGFNLTQPLIALGLDSSPPSKKQSFSSQITAEESEGFSKDDSEYVTVKPFDSPNLVLKIPQKTTSPQDEEWEKDPHQTYKKNASSSSEKTAKNPKRDLDETIDTPPETLLTPPETNTSDQWCLIGNEEGKNQCALVKNAGHCKTGHTYISELECIQTKHYEMIPSPYHEVNRKLSSQKKQEAEKQSSSTPKNESIFSWFF